jgi:hypothetical protein
LRRPDELVGLAVSAAVLLAVAAAAAAVLLRGSGVARFALVAIALDLLLPVSVAGFSQRYAYFAYALVAIALADAVAASPARWPRAAAAAAVAAFAADGVLATREFRAAGLGAERLLAEVAAARAATPAAVSVVVLDPPGEHGPERDVRVWNWGLILALRHRGVEGPIRCVRTVDHVTSSDVERIDAAAAERLRADPEVAVVDVRADGSIVFLPAGRPR